MKRARMVVFRADDPDGGWEPVMPADVPAAIVEPDVMGGMVQGYMAKLRNGVTWYRVEMSDVHGDGQAEWDVAEDTFACRGEN